MNDFYDKLLAAIEEAVKAWSDIREDYRAGYCDGLDAAKFLYDQCVAADLAKRIKESEDGNG